MDTESSSAERLRLIRGEMTQTEFSQRIGVHKNTLGRYERGESALDILTARQICTIFGVSPEWFILGTGPMYDAERVTTQRARAGALRAGDPIAQPAVKPANTEGHVIECTDCQIMLVPMVEARLSAGTGSFEVGEDVERRYAFRTDFLMRKGQPSSMVLMRVTGDSMEPDIKHNDVVLIDQSQRVPRPGLLYAVGVEDLVYLKSVNAEPGKLVLSSYNPDYPPIEVDARGDLSNGIRIIGRAVWVGRELN